VIKLVWKLSKGAAMKQDTTDVGHYRIFAPQTFGRSPYYRVRIRDLNKPNDNPIGWSTRKTVYKHAKAAAIEHVEQLLALESQHGEGLKFKAAFDVFLAPQTNQRTIVGYKSILNHFSEFYDKRIDEITPLQIEDYFKKKLEANELQKTTLQSHFILLRSFFGNCVELDLIPTNPCKKIIKKRWLSLSPGEREAKNNKFTITMDEARKAINASKEQYETVCKGKRKGREGEVEWRQMKVPPSWLWRFLFIGFLTGWRRENLINAKFKYLDAQTGVFIIPAEEMKSKQTFTAPMHPELIYWLTQLSEEERRPEHYLITCSRHTVSDPSNAFESLAKKTGFPLMTPHTMRHSYGRWLSSSNIPPAVKDALMDHHRDDIASVYGRLNGKVDILRPFVNKLPWLFPLEVQSVGVKISLYQIQNNPL